MLFAEKSLKMSSYTELKSILQKDTVNVEEAVKDVMRVKAINPEIDSKLVNK